MNFLLVSVILFMVSTSAIAEETCPVDRPHERHAKSQYGWCSLLACSPKLVCFPGSGACQYVNLNDCNKCSYPVTRLCLSDEELRSAEGKNK